MATNVADLVATLRMDAGQFTRGIQQASGQAQTLTQRFGGLGTALKGALGAVAVKQVLDFGIAMYKVGMESEAFGRKYRAVFGQNTAELDAWVEAHHESFGVANDEVQGYLAQIGNLLTGMGMAADQAGQQATKILELAGAWSAWSGGQISVQDASDKLVKGMMGQTRGLIELGLKVTEQEVSARMAAQGLDELTGAEASRAQQQVMWTLIQEKSTTAVGAYDEALGGAYGAAMTMSTAVDEMKDRIGELVVNLAPAVTFLADLLGLATAFLSLDFSGVSGWVQTNIIETDVSRMADEQKMARQAALMEEMNAAFAGGTSVDEINRYEQAWEELGYTQEHASGIVWGARDAIIQQSLTAARAAGNTMALTVQTGNLAAAQETLAQKTAVATSAMRTHAQAQLEATSKVAAAVGAVQRYNQAQAAAATATGDDLNQALMDQAMAAWEAQAALDALRFDPAALAASIAAIGAALHLTDSEVRALLASLGVLSGTVVDTVIKPVVWHTPGGGRDDGGGSGGGSAFVSAGKGGSTVNIGMVIGDDETVAETVSTALRRAKQRGG